MSNKRPLEGGESTSAKKAKIDQTKKDYLVFKNWNISAFGLQSYSELYIVHASNIPEAGYIRFLYDDNDELIDIRENFSNDMFKIAIDSLNSTRFIINNGTLSLTFSQFQEIRKIYEFFGINSTKLNSLIIMNPIYTNVFSSRSDDKKNKYPKHELKFWIIDPIKNLIFIDISFQEKPRTSPLFYNGYIKFICGDEKARIGSIHLSDLIFMKIDINNKKFTVVKKKKKEDITGDLLYQGRMTTRPIVLDFEKDPIKIFYPRNHGIISKEVARSDQCL